jgi:hypothetical protein
MSSKSERPAHFNPMNIEPLESRIAPASLVLTDLDGDKVTFTTSDRAKDHR